MFPNNHIAKIAAVAATTAPALAFAQSANTITFQGEVSTQTCSVSINGNAANPRVLLQTVPTTQLEAPGSTAGLTTFTIDVTGCTAASSATPIKTVFVGNQVDAGGNLGNTGSAVGVALQLLDPTSPSKPFILPSSAGYAATGLTLAANATSATHNFAVRYYSALGHPTPGSVRGSVQYAISYQ
ncbi:MAG TPA: fimbrial protein [Paraburkholderia sp.]|uniref:fimbrial protein n=1 Tax=Paraburkholderia sp. TaxID=1926495 RepID=UPI002CEE0BBA|nr:fimbrial protein [Paraburkholderia sp.]HTR09077.1 fimbrial protein [Paraburkholderia sp.]